MLTVRPLRRSHNRQGFDCGNEALNRYLRTQASQDIKNGDAACYVLSEDDSDEVYGFFTLSNWLMDRSILGVRSAYPTVSLTLLGRLAVSVNHQSKGFGSQMIASAVYLATNGASGSRGLVVHPKDEQLLSYYQRNGFVQVKGELCAVFLFDKKSF